MKRLGIVLAGLLVVAGCSGGGNTLSDNHGTNDNGGLTAVDQGTVDNSTPAPEGSRPESPQASSNQPTIETASLPIGGGENEVGGLHCVDVVLTGTDGKIPSGVSIKVTKVALDPDGVFSLVSDTCGEITPACDGWSWLSTDFTGACLVAAKQNDGTTAAPGDTVQLILSATVSCADTATCDTLRPRLVGADGGPGSLGGSQVAFTVEAGDQSGPSDSGSPSDSASPSDTSDSDG